MLTKNMQLIVLKKKLKLINNCVYDKAMENLRKRISITVRLEKEKDYLKHVSKATFSSQKIFDKHFAAIHEIKPLLTFNKPIYNGFTVLEFSKWLMFDFHYNVINKNFGDN